MPLIRILAFFYPSYCHPSHSHVIYCCSSFYALFLRFYVLIESLNAGDTNKPCQISEASKELSAQTRKGIHVSGIYGIISLPTSSKNNRRKIIDSVKNSSPNEFPPCNATKCNCCLHTCHFITKHPRETNFCCCYTCVKEILRTKGDRCCVKPAGRRKEEEEEGPINKGGL